MSFDEILLKLGNLKRLDIYYTSAEQTANVLKIMENVRSLEEEGLLKIPDINFIEYYSPQITSYFEGLTQTEVIEMKRKSAELKSTIVSSAHKYVTVDMFDYELMIMRI